MRRYLTCLYVMAALAGCGSSQQDVPGADADPLDAGASMPWRDASGPVESPDPDASAPPADTGGQTNTPSATERFEVVSERTELTDTARGNRVVPVRVYVPSGATGQRLLVLISHGGIGMTGGENRLAHLGNGLAARGIVGVAIGHEWSTSIDQHWVDRPQDVSFVIDQLASGALSLPAAFSGSIDTSRVGHTGHSSGAATGHVLAGATYPYSTHGQLADPRVVAIAPLSPQGEGGIMAYHHGPTDNTWISMRRPLLFMVGGDELDVDGLGLFVADDWRLEPWPLYPDDADRIKILVPGQDHREMGSHGAPEVQEYLAETISRFFFRYLGTSGDACAIGTEPIPPGITPEVEHAQAASGSLLTACP